LPRKKRSNLVSFTQAVGSENDGFRFAQRHSMANVDAATKPKVSIRTGRREEKKRLENVVVVLLAR
jgi:hypothetical protein